MNPFHHPYVEEIAGKVAAILELPAETVAQAVQLPRDPEHGDFTVPCFALAKLVKRPPQEIASEAAAALEPGRFLERAEAKGPYLNFFLQTPARAERVLRAIHEEGTAFGIEWTRSTRPVVLDLSSPNIAKPFHIGHLRSTVIGNALGNIFELLGYSTVRINHIGDWGTQFGRLIAGWKRSSWRAEAEEAETEPIRQLYTVYVRVHDEIEKNPDLAEEGRSWFARLEGGDPEAVDLWTRFRELSLEYFDRIYARLGIHFDFMDGEAFFSDKMDPVIERAEGSGVAEESEGAHIIRLEGEKPPLMLLKSDGATTYATRDLAAALYRQENYDFEQLLYVVGGTQKLHFEQLFEALKRLGYEWADDCHHIWFGQIFGMKTSSGETVSGMSSRAGTALWLEDVLDEAVERARDKARENPDAVDDLEATAENVGIGAIIFHDFMARRIKDLVFDWNDVLNFQGESGPYVQYSHVRTWGILRKAAREVSPNVDFSLLCEEEDRQILIQLESWPEKVLAAAGEYEPSIVARYLLDLSGLFHSYLNKHRVLGDDQELTAARLLLVDSIRRILAGGLGLLGVPAPDRM